MKVKELLVHPITTIGVLATTVLQVTGLYPVWDLVASTSSYWFPALATSGATILPELGYGELGTSLLLGSAIVYVMVQLSRLADRAVDWYEKR